MDIGIWSSKFRTKGLKMVNKLKHTSIWSIATCWSPMFKKKISTGYIGLATTLSLPQSCYHKTANKWTTALTNKDPMNNPKTYYGGWL